MLALREPVLVRERVRQLDAGPAVGAVAQPATVCNTASLTIPSSGAASLYPSDIAVAGLTGVVLDVDVQINGLNHTWPDDIDMLLVGPGGQNLILMSDVGSSFDLVNVNLVFDDSAAISLPDSTQIIGFG